MGLSIRQAEPKDVAFLVDVVVRATHAQGRWPSDFDEETFRSWYAAGMEEQIRRADPGNVTSVIEVEGEAVGRLRITRESERIELSGVHLLPPAQGKGIGTQIIDQLKAEAVAANVPLDLAVDHDNPRARRLYERLGFVHTGEDDKEARLRWVAPS